MQTDFEIEVPVMEPWRQCWRLGFAPHLPTKGLEALAKALREDDPALIQGESVRPNVPFDGTPKRATGACAVAYCAWSRTTRRGDMILELEQKFADICARVDNSFEYLPSTRRFLNWYDRTPRDEMRAELLPEVEMELESRIFRQMMAPNHTEKRA